MVLMLVRLLTVPALSKIKNQMLGRKGTNEQSRSQIQLTASPILSIAWHPPARMQPDTHGTHKRMMMKLTPRSTPSSFLTADPISSRLALRAFLSR